MIQDIRLFLMVSKHEFFMPLLICLRARNYLRIKAFSPYRPYGVFYAYTTIERSIRKLKASFQKRKGGMSDAVKEPRDLNF